MATDKGSKKGGSTDKNKGQDPDPPPKRTAGAVGTATVAQRRR
jgi:hypothetical protein